MSRKRIAAAALMVVALGLGLVGYLHATSGEGTQAETIEPAINYVLGETPQSVPAGERAKVAGDGGALQFIDLEVFTPVANSFANAGDIGAVFVHTPRAGGGSYEHAPGTDGAWGAGVSERRPIRFAAHVGGGRGGAGGGIGAGGVGAGGGTGGKPNSPEVPEGNSGNAVGPGPHDTHPVNDPDPPEEQQPPPPPPPPPGPPLPPEPPPPPRPPGPPLPPGPPPPPPPPPPVPVTPGEEGPEQPPVQVPEPGTLGLLGFSLAALVLRRRHLAASARSRR